MDIRRSQRSTLKWVLLFFEQVIPGEFGGVSRVTAPGSMVAMATSRSLGDFHFKRNYSS